MEEPRSPGPAKTSNRPAHWSLFSFLIALAAVAIAAGISEFLDGPGARFLILIPAVSIAAISGGLPAGLFAAAASALLIVFFRHGPAVAHGPFIQADSAGIFFLVLSGAIISSFAEIMHRSCASAQALREKDAIRQAEQALRETEERYSELVDQARDGILCTQGGRLIVVNRAAADMLGYTADEMLGKPNLDFISPHFRSMVEEKIRQRLQGMEPAFHYESQLVRKDGAFLDVEVSAGRINQGGRPATFSIFRDITRRKRMERLDLSRLKLFKFASTHSLREILQATLDEMEELTGSTVSFYHFFEADQSALCLQAWSTRTRNEFCRAGDSGQHFDLSRAGVWADAIRESRPIFHNDFASLSGQKGMPEGHAAIIREMIVPINRAGNMVALIGMGNKPVDYTAEDLAMVSALADLTWEIIEHKWAEEAINAAEIRWQSTFDALRDAVWALDKDSRIIRCNEATRAVMGLDPDKILGRYCWEVVHKLNCPINGCPNSRTRLTLQREEMTLVINDRHFKVVVDPILDENRGFSGAVHIVSDVTESVRSREEMDHLQQALHESQKMEAIGTLAGGIAHDFNNILTAILGYSELARMLGGENDRLHQCLEEVITASERAKELVGQILTFSRKSHAESGPVHLSRLLREALKLIRASLPSTIEIRQSVRAENARIEADPTRVHQVIMNLATNAYQAMMERGGVLKIRLEEIGPRDTPAKAFDPGVHRDRWAMLTVSDTGNGIPDHILPRIFDPYFTTKKKGTGTGLGLAVVKAIVDGLGGAIRVESREGMGSTFRVMLPCCEDAEARCEDETDIIPGKRGERILFVDDEITLAELGKELLETIGYSVVAVSDSNRAMEIFREEPDKFDLIVTDYTMPGMTGDELTKNLLMVRPDIPIIIYSGQGEQLSEQEAKRFGAKALLRKPISISDFSSIIRPLLDGK